MVLPCTSPSPRPRRPLTPGCASGWGLPVLTGSARCSAGTWTPTRCQRRRSPSPLASSRGPSRCSRRSASLSSGAPKRPGLISTDGESITKRSPTAWLTSWLSRLRPGRARGATSDRASQNRDDPLSAALRAALRPSPHEALRRSEETSAPRTFPPNRGRRPIGRQARLEGAAGHPAAGHPATPPQVARVQIRSPLGHGDSPG